MNYDVIIIGAGLGGLTAGAKLARNGKKVLLIEQYNIPGGCATTFKRKDFTVEVGLHEMDGLDEIDSKKDIFDDLDIFNNIKLLRLPEFYRFISPNIDFVMPDDAKEAIASLIEKFPAEEKGIRNYFKQIRGIRKEVPKLPLSKFWQTVLLPIYPLLYPYVVRNAKKTIGQFFDENIKNDDLKLLLTANLGYYHDDPYSMAMVYFSSAQDGYYAGGWYIKGGSQKLSDYLAECITKNGGEVVYRHLVENILIDNGKATGVVYRKKSKKETEKITARAKHIIANNAIPIISKMLPKEQSLKLEQQISGLEKSCSVITLYLGFSKTPKELGTAKTVERYTLNPGGAVYGFAQTPQQGGHNRFGQRSPIKNLHFASAWGFPGGGFTGAIISGFLTSLKIK